MERYDVVVVGAGPAGSLAARAAAEGGATTLLVDRRIELGEPVQCGEFLPEPQELLDLFDCGDVVAPAYDIPPATVLRSTTEMVVVSPYGHRYRFPLAGMTVSRRAFDKALALRAEGAGAELRHPVGVVGADREGVRLARGDRIRAKVVIAADGPISTVARSLGFRPRRFLYRMITATVDGSFPDEIDLYFGTSAPGGYGWMIPRAADANVGLGVTHLPPRTTLGGLLRRFTGKFELGQPHDPTTWWVPIGPPPPSLVVGRTLFVGDAANLVMATNGGGIPTALISGWDAGSVAARHLREAMPLSEYDRLIDRHLSGPLARAFQVKRVGDWVVDSDLLLALGMRYIGTSGLDAMMRLRWPARLGGAS